MRPGCSLWKKAQPLRCLFLLVPPPHRPDFMRHFRKSLLSLVVVRWVAYWLLRDDKKGSGHNKKTLTCFCGLWASGSPQRARHHKAHTCIGLVLVFLRKKRSKKKGTRRNTKKRSFFGFLVSPLFNEKDTRSAQDTQNFQMVCFVLHFTTSMLGNARVLCILSTLSVPTHAQKMAAQKAKRMTEASGVGEQKKGTIHMLKQRETLWEKSVAGPGEVQFRRPSQSQRRARG